MPSRGTPAKRPAPNRGREDQSGRPLQFRGVEGRRRGLGRRVTEGAPRATRPSPTTRVVTKSGMGLSIRLPESSDAASMATRTCRVPSWQGVEHQVDDGFAGRESRPNAPNA